MLRLKHLKLGNLKLPRSVARFDLPTAVCGQKCPNCYANKLLFPAVVAYRNRCLELANSADFVSVIDHELKMSRAPYCRPHCSGDFFSQDYVDKWTEVMQRNKKIRFFFWTKALQKFDFSTMVSLKHVNVMDSWTPLGLNYGDREFITQLKKEHGYFICPDQGAHTLCMSKCRACLTKKKVCFLIH